MPGEDAWPSLALSRERRGGHSGEKTRLVGWRGKVLNTACRREVRGGEHGRPWLNTVSQRGEGLVNMVSCWGGRPCEHGTVFGWGLILVNIVSSFGGSMLVKRCLVLGFCPSEHGVR